MKIFLCFAALACFAALVAGDKATAKPGIQCFEETEKNFEEFEKEMADCLKGHSDGKAAEGKCLLKADKMVDDEDNVKLDDLMKKADLIANPKYVDQIKEIYKECAKKGLKVNKYAACIYKHLGKDNMNCDDFRKVAEIEKSEKEADEKEA